MPFDEDKIEDNHSIEGKNTSKATDSTILEPGKEDTKLMELARLLSDKMGLNHFQQEIDSLKETDKAIIAHLDKLSISQDQIINLINTSSGIAQGKTTTPANTEIQNIDLSKIDLIGTLADKFASAYVKYKEATSPSGVGTIIDQKYINEQVGNSVKRKFEMGDMIYDAIEATLTKKTAKKVVDTALSVKHEPE